MFPSNNNTEKHSKQPEILYFSISSIVKEASNALHFLSVSLFLSFPSICQSALSLLVAPRSLLQQALFSFPILKPTNNHLLSISSPISFVLCCCAAFTVFRSAAHIIIHSHHSLIEWNIPFLFFSSFISLSRSFFLALRSDFVTLTLLSRHRLSPFLSFPIFFGDCFYCFQREMCRHRCCHRRRSSSRHRRCRFIRNDVFVGVVLYSFRGGRLVESIENFISM